MTRRRWHRQDRGAAMVEMAFVVPILVVLLTGIVAFGLAMNQKQDVTRVAAEGARVGAVALPPTANPASQASDPRYVAALDALDGAVQGSFTSSGCNSSEATCEVRLHDCSVEMPAVDLLPPITNTGYFGNAEEDCVTVIFGYSDGLALRHLPFVGRVIPDALFARSVARLNMPS